MSDWRADYLICPHVAADPEVAAFHAGFRVACFACCERSDVLGRPRMLHEASIETWTSDGLTLYQLPPYVVSFYRLYTVAGREAFPTEPSWSARYDRAPSAADVLREVRSRAATRELWIQGIIKGHDLERWEVVAADSGRVGVVEVLAR